MVVFWLTLVNKHKVALILWELAVYQQGGGACLVGSVVGQRQQSRGAGPGKASEI